MWLLPDGRVVVVLISPGGNTRDKILRPSRLFTQTEVGRDSRLLNRHYSGWTLEAIRGDLLPKTGNGARTLRRHGQSALTLCDPAVLETNPPCTARRRDGPNDCATEFVDQAQLRDLTRGH